MKLKYHQKQILKAKNVTRAINQSINQSIRICIAPPTNSGRRRLTMWQIKFALTVAQVRKHKSKLLK